MSPCAWLLQRMLHRAATLARHKLLPTSSWNLGAVSVHQRPSLPRLHTPSELSSTVSSLRLLSTRAASRPSSSDTFLFTSESVTEGHPDKLCDQVSDAVLDACLTQDPGSKVACEAAVKDNFLLVFGEITSHADVDYAAVARQACRDIGYTSQELGFDADSAEIRVLIRQQSPEIGWGVHGMGTKRLEEMGAGDQGHMFGYACSETPELMPATHMLASQLAMRLAAVRKSGELPWLRPDGKTQVTIEYAREGGRLHPQHLHTLLISTQHHPDISQKEIAELLQKHVIAPVVLDHLVTERTRFIINPSGSFVLGGPYGDAGLTGRKIIVDTYGGWGAHGGGAFSGKDPSKVDRSAAYAARQAAKAVVASGLAERCLLQISYGIGVPEPLSLFVDTYGTGKLPDREILEAIQARLDFRPGVIIERLGLQDGRDNRYRKTAAYGHFGRNHDPSFTWEQAVQL